MRWTREPNSWLEVGINVHDASAFRFATRSLLLPARIGEGEVCHSFPARGYRSGVGTASLSAQFADHECSATPWAQARLLGCNDRAPLRWNRERHAASSVGAVVARIEDYALIGDCETGALVARDGSIDWLCLPRFDSESCFAKLLGDEQNGRWLLAPNNAGSVTRQYLPGTLVLETVHTVAGGTARVIDFMPLKNGNSTIVRIVEGIDGQVRMNTELVVRFDGGATIPWVNKLHDGSLNLVAGPHMLELRSEIPLSSHGTRSFASFSVTAGERVRFVLTYQASWLAAAPSAQDADALLQSTEQFWHYWSSRYHGAGSLREAASRSLITLKALTFRPTGGVVAAITTSLPEQIGGARNWDYRYCWIRDATLTLLALMASGYYDEAEAWRDWLIRAVAGSPTQLQIMYGVSGERRLTEWEVPWLAGYEGSRPVRIGNAAHTQLQLDVYGELMDALYQSRCDGLPENRRAWAIERVLLDHLTKIWARPDHGIWEMRGEPRQFTYSKVMAWVAFDRGIKSAEEFGMPGEVDEWKKLREVIHDDVCRNGYDALQQAFVQSYGGTGLDACLLRMPALGFLPPDDPRMLSTISAIERKLLVDGLVRRCDPAPSAPGPSCGEGAFLACSFWLADAYHMTGRNAEAHALLRKLLGLRNDVGLLSEEYAPEPGRLVGNFPQALSHVAMVNTVHRLTNLT
ncbi:glycoside hydrolase family 15 protein [Bradyrhizobium jicamae]|uniref:Glycoside hydrolase family 15 protein n=1 Tax=Bradyrhizobium jicamae TaxID=280332 RepID=A0ABS5FKV9_9BRAD|nr:glycoside hydrolase family 15 protein [Bradyrhizobium jicamae]